MRKNSLGHILVRVVGNANVFKLHQTAKQVSLCFVLILADVAHLFQLLLLHFHDPNCLLKELLENKDSFLVSVDLCCVLFLGDRKVKPVFFQDLHWRLSRHRKEDLVNLSLAPGEDLELFREDNVIVLSDLLHEPLKQGSSLLHELLVLLVYQLLLRDRRDVAAGPSVSQHCCQGVELAVSSYLRKVAFVINSFDRILDMASNLNRVLHLELLDLGAFRLVDFLLLLVFGFEILDLVKKLVLCLFGFFL